MNYNIFKSMLDVLIKTYRCPFCGSEVDESHIDIVGTAGTTMNIEVICPKCQRHSMVKAEVAQIDGRKTNLVSGASLEEIKANLFDILKKNLTLDENISKNSIKDEDIVSLSRDLQKDDIKIEDLFK